MLASAIWKWGAGHMLRAPATWILAGLLFVLVPVASRLSPFPEIGIDPAWGFVKSWALPVGLVATSAAMAFLQRYDQVLAQVAPRTRWGGELGLLLLAPAGLWACLGLSALVSALLGPLFHERVGALVPPGWIAALVLVALHLASVALLVLRMPAPGPVRIGALWAWFWLVPAFAGESPLGPLVDPLRHLDTMARFAESPLTLLPSALLLAGLLVLGASLPAPRAARASR